MSHQTSKPALPEGHPFVNVFSGWYWTSTTAAINTAYAWYIHMEGARMFYGQKEQFFLLWPVRGKGDTILPATGQTRCYDAKGQLISCARSGQDGEFQSGVRWPATSMNWNPWIRRAHARLLDIPSLKCIEFARLRVGALTNAVGVLDRGRAFLCWVWISGKVLRHARRP